MRMNRTSEAKNSGNDAKVSAFIRFISKMKIGARVRAMLILLICSIAVPVILMITETSRYMNTYNEVLENLESIRYIMNESNQQGSRILGYCVIGKDIKESGETEIIIRMQNKIGQIRENIGTDNAYEENLAQLNTVENLLNNYVQSYKEGLGLCGDSFSLAGDVKFYSMVNTSEYLTKNCNELLSLELDRSSLLKQRIISNFRSSLLFVTILSVVIILLAAVLSFSVTRSITVPVQLLRGKISVVASGDLSGSAIHINTKDELGEVSEAFNTMKNSLQDILEKVSGVSGEIETSVVSVTEKVEDNSSRSEELSATMDSVMQKMERQMTETTTAKQQAGEVSRVSERISSNVNKIMESAEKSLQDSKTGSNNITLYTNQLQEVNAIMNQVSDVAQELNNSAGQMNAIIQTITNIAEQTTLLALNASIEAARAGESGRGFAVVANEVRTLADNSSASTQEISNIITQLQSYAREMTVKMHDGLTCLEDGNRIAQDTMKSFGNIQQGIELINSNIREILQDISELSQSVSIICKNIDSVHGVTDENTSATAEIVGSVHEESANLQKVAKIMFELSGRAKQLEEAVSQFKLS